MTGIVLNYVGETAITLVTLHIFSESALNHKNITKENK